MDKENKIKKILKIKIKWLYFWNPIKFWLKKDRVISQNYWIYKGPFKDSKLKIVKMCWTKNMLNDIKSFSTNNEKLN